jgi:hypothetical protein
MLRLRRNRAADVVWYHALLPGSRKRKQDPRDGQVIDPEAREGAFSDGVALLLPLEREIVLVIARRAARCRAHGD